MSTEVKLELSPVTGTRDVAILAPAAKRNKSIEAAGTRRRGWSDFRQRIRFIGRFAAAFSIDYQGADSVFTSYMPRILHQQLLTYSQKGLGGYQLEFRGEGRHVKAACMFSDASGFTQLTEKLAQLPTGAETMCGIMNKYLTLMIDTISQHGGDVVKFAGDALLVVFPIDSSADAPPGTFSTALDATMQAAKCACALAKGPLHNWEAWVDPTTQKVYTLSLHIGVGVGAGEGCGGTLTALHVGGVGGRWEFVLAGPPMVQVNTAEPLAASGEVCVSGDAWELIKPYASGHPPAEDPGGFMLVDEITDGAPKMSVTLPMLTVNRDIANLMKRYVPNAISGRLEAGIESHIAEVRPVTVLFINCHGVRLAANPDGSAPTLKTVTADGKKLMRTVQKLVDQYEGAVNKMLVDDKGTLIVVSLGLPPRPHPDDPVRAVGLALQLRAAFQKLRSSEYDSPPPQQQPSSSSSAAATAAPPAVSGASEGASEGSLQRASSGGQYAEKSEGLVEASSAFVEGSLAFDEASASASRASELMLDGQEESEASIATPVKAGGGGGGGGKGGGRLSLVLSALSPTNLLFGGGGKEAEPPAPTAPTAPSEGNGGAAGGNGSAASAGAESTAAGGGGGGGEKKEKKPPLEGAWSCSIGIASGRAFCGVVGYPRVRNEYTLMGDTVNLAARLMGHATKEGLGVLVDTSTFMMTDAKTVKAKEDERVEYVTLEPVRLKGKANPIPIFQPTKMVKRATQEKQSEEVLAFGGRAPELAQLRKMFAMLNTFGNGGTMILLGERGSGKKKVVKELEKMGEATGMAVVVGKDDVAKHGASEGDDGGDADGWNAMDKEIMERSDLYGAWTTVFSKVLKVLMKRAEAQGGRVRGVREDAVIRDALASHLGEKDSRLEFWYELNAVFGRVVAHAPRGYKPPPDTRRGQTVADLAVCVLLEAAVHTDLLLILHLITRTSVDASLNTDAWKIANAVARAASSRTKNDKTFLLCIVSRSSMFKETIADVEEIVALAKKPLDTLVRVGDDNRILSLEPYDEARRQNYLYEMLKNYYCKTLKEDTPDDLPHGLVTYVSETAAGVPLQIEEVIKSLKEQNALTFHAKAGKGLKVRCPSLSELLDDSKYKVPSKIVGAATRVFENLSERHQLIVKLLSPLEAFSIGMVLGLLVKQIRFGRMEGAAEDDDNKMFEEEIFELFQGQGVLEEISPPDDFIRRHDPTAEKGYVFSNKLMQREVKKILLRSDLDKVNEHMEHLATTVKMQQKAETSQRDEVRARDAQRRESAIDLYRRSSGSLNSLSGPIDVEALSSPSFESRRRGGTSHGFMASAMSLRRKTFLSKKKMKALTVSSPY